MAFADLASNQMVDENNASTGGFVVIGPKNQPTECYTKARALATYQLNASAMNAYANTQLVPKSVWQTAPPISATSVLASNVWIFNISRPAPFSNAKASSASDTIINSGTQNIGNANIGGGSSFQIGRLCAVFDTTGVTVTPTAGTMSFYVTANIVGNSLTFNMVNPNTVFTPLQVLTTADWDNWNGSHDGSGGTNATRTINANQTGKITFFLSSFQLNLIKNNAQFAAYIISNGDLQNSSPANAERPVFSAEKGLGLSGIGDYELALSY